MRTRVALRALPALRVAAPRNPYSTIKSPQVPLSYEVHEPANPSSKAPGAIIFMHGLFGSKKNNRSIKR
ncbi:hypothetical protein HYFRA_00001267 [Hymenoscyphus fraxineus]|uniref:Uncharacterized protein n=1 Tax=Hymenoscyphus fraxineus TaxID=746836 RepID=A0A9N9L4L1_9HELO|nr:hypothetical protein HYFRA_00001267 [Hymenoscyphus fraxineus]